MFVVYKYYEGAFDHKYFNKKENAEEYASELKKLTVVCRVELEEVQIED